MNAYKLKLIAIFGMTLDHAYCVFQDILPLWVQIFMRSFGGLTFPIMAYLLVEGYKRTSNMKRYAKRLLLFAVLSELPHMWAMQGFGLNIMFTLLLGMLTLYLYENIKNRARFWFSFAGLILFSIIMDWSLIGVPMVLLYYVLQGKWKKVIIPVLLPLSFAVGQFMVHLIIPSMSALQDLPSLAFGLIGCSLTIPLLVMYNGERGYSQKYLFYFYYPGHLFVLALMRGILLQDWTLL